jgi:hypothetical protein
MKFKIIKSGGRTVIQEVQRSIPEFDHGHCRACVDGRDEGGRGKLPEI